MTRSSGALPRSSASSIENTDASKPSPSAFDAISSAMSRAVPRLVPYSTASRCPAPATFATGASLASTTGAPMFSRS